MVTKKSKVLKTPTKDESTTETEDDNKVFRFDANGNLYADKKHPQQGKGGSGGGSHKGELSNQSAVSPKKSSGTGEGDAAGRGTSSQRNPQQKPTKRFYLHTTKKATQKNDSSDDDASSSGSSDSSDDSSSSSESEEESEVDDNADDDDYVNRPENEDEDSEEIEEQPPPKPKKGYKTKVTREAPNTSNTQETVSGSKKKTAKKKDKTDKEKKTRNSRWTDSENRRLVDHVRPKFELLTGKFKKLDGKNAKDHAWKVVTGIFHYIL